MNPTALIVKLNSLSGTLPAAEAESLLDGLAGIPPPLTRRLHAGFVSCIGFATDGGDPAFVFPRELAGVMNQIYNAWLAGK